MGDARSGALEPLSRAVIKSWGLRGSKNEVQMRGGFEASAQVPGGGGVWGGGGRGAWNPYPPNLPGTGTALIDGCGRWGTRGMGARWEGPGGRHQGSAPAGSSSPRQRASLLGTPQRCLRVRLFFSFFFFWSIGSRAELLRFNNRETRRGRWQTGDHTLMGGVGGDKNEKCGI